MLSFAAELSSVATVSPPSSFEAFLDWLQSGVVHPGKLKKQKGRRGILQRGKLVAVNAVWTSSSVRRSCTLLEVLVGDAKRRYLVTPENSAQF